MLDRYWYGHVERISPEAPVPVVSVNKSDERLGGAANVARNVTALGGKCTLLAVCGDDKEADIIEKLLLDSRIEGVLEREKLINTTIKLRVISMHQQLLRIDFEPPASKDAHDRVLKDYMTKLPEFDAVVISDYGKGGLGFIVEMISAARKAGKSVLIDPKGDDYGAYRGASLITPNRKEFEQVAGRFMNNEDLAQRATELIKSLDLGGLLVTRGEDGMSLFESGKPPQHVPVRAREVFDVTGAGDTVIAVIAAAYAVHADSREAVELANVAAGIVVGKLGAATVSPDEILNEISH